VRNEQQTKHMVLFVFIWFIIMAYPMSMCIRKVSLQSLSVEMFRSESRHVITISRLSVKLPYLWPSLSPPFPPVMKKIHNIKLILLSFLEPSLLSWLQLIQYLWLCSARRYEYFDLWFNLDFLWIQTVPCVLFVVHFARNGSKSFTFMNLSPTFGCETIIGPFHYYESNICI
jgi:hypothetical protein